MPSPLPADEMVSPHAVELEYVYSSAEAERCSMAMSRAIAPMSRFIPWLGLVLALLSLYLIWARPDSGLRVLIPSSVGAVLILYPAFTRWSARRDFHRMPGANATIRWRINAQTLTSRGPSGETTLEWNALLQVKPTKHGYLLFTDRFVAQWLPRGAFASAEEVARFETWIRANQDRFGTNSSLRARAHATAHDASATRQPAQAFEEDATRSVALVITFTYTAEEASRARRAMYDAIPIWIRFAPWFPVLAVAIVALAVLAQRWDWRRVVLWMVLLFAVFLLVRIRIQRRRAQEFAESPAANREVRWRIDGERLNVAGAHTDASFRWTALVKVRETVHGFLLFQQPRLAQWLPTTAFANPADLTQFRSWIQEHAIDFRRVS